MVDGMAEREKAVRFLSEEGFVLFPVGEKLDVSYRICRIPKNEKDINKGFRTLTIPNDFLKEIQRQILSGILYNLPVSPIAHGSVPGHSPETHAKLHLESQARFRVDIADAFPSTTRKMLRKALVPLIRSSEKYRKANVLANALSWACTYQNSIPQGSPTGSYVFNLVCYQLDLQLISICQKFQLTLSRYTDDFQFSTKQPKIEKEARKAIVKTIKHYGFQINRKKIKYNTGKAIVPKITGITLLKEARMGLPGKLIERYRAIIFNATRNKDINPGQVWGILGWVRNIYGEKLPNRLQKPFLEFLKARCPNKIHKFIHLVTLPVDQIESK